MKTEVFKISSRKEPGSPIYFEEVQGTRISVCDIPCFIFNDEEGYWNVSHLETGMLAALSANRSDAIKIAQERFSRNAQAIEKGKQLLIENGIDLPVNAAPATKGESK